MSSSDRPTKYLPEHPLAPVCGVIDVARLVLWEKLEGIGAPCHWCEDPLVWMETLCADHLDGDPKNNHPDNLVPSCRGCNANREDGTGRGRIGHRTCQVCTTPYVARRKIKHCSFTCAMESRKRGPHKIPDHGTCNRYNKGCRCTLCKEASSVRYKDYLRRKKLALASG